MSVHFTRVHTVQYSAKMLCLEFNPSIKVEYLLSPALPYLIIKKKTTIEMRVPAKITVERQKFIRNPGDKSCRSENDADLMLMRLEKIRGSPYQSFVEEFILFLGSQAFLAQQPHQTCVYKEHYLG
ncbi:hypothetical protein FGO68_gene11317 [Halteria grandinella]|uniref:Uncharacterized protein n=1 Tax=Halteria grandinella TaxID=5974 RepID=A0A8J8P394_HALGN|nr:hypothetical protein FGO68_gene11317 [Halteria grandinella]